jgi:CheY-like chemotaxis protein
VLLVDDEPRVLDALRRTLRGRYAVETANSGSDGLQLLSGSEDGSAPIGVIVSDMMMPGMNGAQFLAKARELAPDSVRLILSGQADLPSTIAAVNDADLFRFLSKPIDPQALTSALDAAVRQYELVFSERELLQKTLTGVVDVLAETLAVASPLAYRRTTRVRLLMSAVAGELGLINDWRLLVAAMLSQVGCIAVPSPVLQKVEEGRALDHDDRRMYRGHPEVAKSLLSRIPRLEEVAEWIGDQVTEAEGLRPGPLEQDRSRACFAAVEAFLAGYDAGVPADEMADALTSCQRFPPDVVRAVLDGSRVLTPRGVPRSIQVVDLRPGMVLDQDVHTMTDTVLVRKGEHATEALVWRLNNFAASVGIKEPIEVLVPLVRHL